MKNKPLLLWGLGAGVVALVVFIVGYAFVWPADNEGHECGLKQGRHGMMERGALDEDGECDMSGIMEDMMDGDSYSGMEHMMGGGVHGMMGGPVDAATAPISIDQAADAARSYLSDQGDTDLKATRILEFTNGFYARVNELSTGTGAYELWIDRNSGEVSRTMGPGIIWNQKYRGGIESMMAGDGFTDCMNGGDDGGDDKGYMEDMMDDGVMEDMHGEGMMGLDTADNSSTTGSSNADMTIKAEDARSRAQKYADVQFPGSTAGSSPDTFYGYYIVDIVKDGRVLAILSVNGYSGQVWEQAWLGSYLGGKAL